MSDLGLGQKAIVMPHYPHMLAEDVDVWTSFLLRTQMTIERVWYDVKVGKAVESEGESNSLKQRIADGITRKRIDVVALVDIGYLVIEVKPVANMTALGQVMTYTTLFRREYEVRQAIYATIICRTADEDLTTICEQGGIILIQIEQYIL